MSVLLIAASSVVIVAVDLSGDGRQMIVNTQTRLTYTSGRLWSQSECQRLVNPGRHVRTLTDRHTDTQTYRQRDRLSERISRKIQQYQIVLLTQQAGYNTNKTYTRNKRNFLKSSSHKYVHL